MMKAVAKAVEPADREARFDRLAQHVRDAIDLPEIISWLKIKTAS